MTHDNKTIKWQNWQHLTQVCYWFLFTNNFFMIFHLSECQCVSMLLCCLICFQAVFLSYLNEVKSNKQWSLAITWLMNSTRMKSQYCTYILYNFRTIGYILQFLIVWHTVVVSWLASPPRSLLSSCVGFLQSYLVYFLPFKNRCIIWVDYNICEWWSLRAVRCTCLIFSVRLNNMTKIFYNFCNTEYIGLLTNCQQYRSVMVKNPKL